MHSTSRHGQYLLNVQADLHDVISNAAYQCSPGQLSIDPAG